MRFMLFFVFIFFFSLVAQTAKPGLDSVYINSGNPKFPFPQFLPYQNGALGNLGTHNGVGVPHAEMEQTIRDAYRIMMNKAAKGGKGVGGINYVTFASTPFCSEGDGYAMLAVVAMADKTTFDGMWLWIHDNAMNKVKRYSDCQMSSQSYAYSRLPGWTNAAGANSAADGDFDIGLALLMAYYQWGEFMGVNDACGNPISYKHDAIEFLKGLSDTLLFALSGNSLVSGDIGIDGYFKGGDTWNELTDWASDPVRAGTSKPSAFVGPRTQYFDYTAPSYFHAFADFLAGEDSATYAWNIKQFRRAEASSDWLMGQALADPSTIPFIGGVELSAANVPKFSNVQPSEDVRLAWRTILNYVWHGNPSSTWDPVAHQVKDNAPNSFERDMGARYARFLWDARQTPWKNGCVAGNPATASFWGPSVLYTGWNLNGTGGSFHFLNWIQGTGSPSAVVSQDFELMAEMYRQCEIEWDGAAVADRYLGSVPVYFHEWFRLLGLLVLSGNYHTPLSMAPSANVKVYMAIDKTFGFQNDSVTYTIDYRNYGSQDAQNVLIVDTLPKDFIFLSAPPNGVFNSAANTVMWPIGTVPGFKTETGVKPTTGQVVLKIRVGNPTQKQYRNRAVISCSNGSGWASNEYPNEISSIMKRNYLDIAKRALVVKPLVSVPNPKAGSTVQFTVNFKNTSDAGWINGGRQGVHFSYSQSLKTGIGPSNSIRVRLFHDADEAYIDYGNYRLSYFLYDSLLQCIAGTTGCASGWSVTPLITEGIDKTYAKIFLENITPGRDSSGKWNQRIVIQFSDPSNPNRVQNLATVDHMLQTYYGQGYRIHRGGTVPLRLVWNINPSNWAPTNWGDDWSWDPDVVDSDGGIYWPVTADWTDPDKPDVPVTTWNPKNCELATHTVKNILVEEWDGYTWRRVAGNGPLPGRDVKNVVIYDTVPAGLTLNPESVTTPPGFAKSITGNVITLTKPVMQVNDSGQITFTAQASSSCPQRMKRVVNRSWISGLNESPVSDSVSVNLTCDSISVTPTKSALALSDPLSNVIRDGDTARIDTTVFYITVKDSDQNLDKNAPDVINTLVTNPSTGDSLVVKLVETGNATGVFRSASPVGVASQSGPNKIPAFGGETVYITYTDQFDSTDISQAHIVTLSAFPVPVYGWILDANGDGRADSAVVVYSKALTAKPDSLQFFFPDQANVRTVKTGQGAMQQNGNIVTVSFAMPFTAATTGFVNGGTGSGYSFIAAPGPARRFFPLADSVGPILSNAQVVERAIGAVIDTLYVTFSEAIKPASLKGASLILIKNGVPSVISIDSARKLTPTRFALTCAAGVPQPLPGDSLRINPAGPVQDNYGNKAHLLNPWVPITLKQIPPIIVRAYYIDRDPGGAADGYCDTAKIQFNKKVSLSDLSFQLDWGLGLNVTNITGDTIAYFGPDSMSVGIALRTVFPYTGLLRTSGDMFVTARFNSFPGESRLAKVSDGAAPVIDTATYIVNATSNGSCDTLIVGFSESVNINQALNPFQLAGKTSPAYTLALSKIAVTGDRATFCVSQTNPVGLPRSGDTIWIAANSSISDSGGVFQNNPNNRKVLIKVLRPRSNWKISIACNPFSPGLICASTNGGAPGTVIAVTPDPASLLLGPMTLNCGIFDVLGNSVFESQSAQKGADGNSYYFVWDGRNKNGRWVGSGVYRAIVTVTDENGTSSKSRTIGVKR